jgi:hypothetical protein
MSDTDELRQWAFRLGDVFKSDDPVARFVVVVAIGLNDNILANRAFVEHDEPHELLYFFHLASGHLWELAERLEDAWQEWEPVQEFVKSLPVEYQNDFASITALIDPEDPTGRLLSRIRHQFFHYPHLRKSTADRQRLPLQRVLKDGADAEMSLVAGGGGLGGGIRARFADDILVRLMTLTVDETELQPLLARLGELQAAFNRFAQMALGRFLAELPTGVLRESPVADDSPNA